MPYRCLFHVHTRRSFDSLLSARTILSRSIRSAVQVLIITDHNTIQGARDAQALTQSNITPLVITAAEYQSEKGDIIGIFLKQEIQSRISSEIIDQIHAQNGLVILPHPYKGHKLDDALLSGVDLIETYNSRCSDSDNAQARQLAKQWKLPSIAGADAHCSLELHSAINEFPLDPPRSALEFREHLLTLFPSFVVSPAPGVCRPYSQMVKAVKTKNPHLFLYQLKRLALTLAHGQQ
jgi:predicted metal-dependent phosphoesterase TrpH